MSCPNCNENLPNTVQVLTPYYEFIARTQNSAYKDIVFLPYIFISSLGNNKIRINVAVQEFNKKTKQGKFRKTFSYNQNIKQEILFFKKLQNSDFTDALPNSLIFLKKMIDVVKELVTKNSKASDVSVNASPLQVYPEGSGCAPCPNAVGPWCC